MSPIQRILHRGGSFTTVQPQFVLILVKHQTVIPLNPLKISQKQYELISTSHNIEYFFPLVASADEALIATRAKYAVSPQPWVP